MQTLVCWLLVALVATGTWATLPPPERSYNILMLLPVSSKSHRNVFMPLATALTERGHKVTMLSNHPPPDGSPNIHHIQNPLDYFDTDVMEAFDMLDSHDQMFQMFEEGIPRITREIYDVPVVADLYKRRKEFDLIVIDDYFNEAMFPFSHNHTFITVSSSDLLPCSSATMGNLLNPAYVPNLLETYEQPFSTLTRWKNFVFNILSSVIWRKSTISTAQTEISKRFPDLPSVDEMSRNRSLMLINTHFSHMLPVPLLPNQIQVGGIHIGPTKPLPKELADFLSGSIPVVYMSLGTVARSSSMPQKFKDVFYNVFEKLPYKVLWKFEEKPQKELKNVLVQKWMPQQDILAHPNVKVFISHCGMLGSQEALYHGTPILGLPIFGDQPRNADGHVFAGVGRKILWSELTEELLSDAIEDLITNPKYGENASKISRAMKDRPQSALDTAVYWTEYVVRHRGAAHLRSPARGLSWVEMLHLDVLLALHLVVFVLVMLSRKVFGLFWKRGLVDEVKKKA